MTLSGQQPLRPQADWLRQLTHIRQQMAEQAAELDRSGDFPRAPASERFSEPCHAGAVWRGGGGFGPAAAGDYRHCVGGTGDGADRLYAVSASSASGGERRLGGTAASAGLSRCRRARGIDQQPES